MIVESERQTRGWRLLASARTEPEVCCGWPRAADPATRVTPHVQGQLGRRATEGARLVSGLRTWAAAARPRSRPDASPVGGACTALCNSPRSAVTARNK